MYADKSEIFNKHVLDACELSDTIAKLSSEHVRNNLKNFPQKPKHSFPIDATDSKSEDEDDEKAEEIHTPQPKSS